MIGYRRRASAALLAALCLLALAAPATTLAQIGATGPNLRTTLPSIEHEVMCVTCKIPLQVAKSVQANREREYITSLIDRGMTKAQVKRTLVSQYGESVLGMPGAHGINLAVYLVPIAVVLFLIATVATLLPTWRRHARAQARRVPVIERLDTAETARLDADLARFD